MHCYISSVPRHMYTIHTSALVKNIFLPVACHGNKINACLGYCNFKKKIVQNSSRLQQCKLYDFRTAKSDHAEREKIGSNHFKIVLDSIKLES
jgi:hypothetical protein